MIKKMLDQKIAPYLANRGFDMSPTHAPGRGHQVGLSIFTGVGML